MNEDEVKTLVDEREKTLSDKFGDLIDKKMNEIDEKIKTITVTASQKEEDEHATGGFKSLGHFAQAVARSMSPEFSRKLSDDERANLKTLNTIQDSQGGYTVPVQFSRNVWERSIEGDIFYEKAFDIPVEGQRVEIPYIKDDSHSTAPYGIALYYKNEEAQYTATDFDFGRIGLEVNKLTGLAYISDEMLQDSFVTIEAYTNRLFANSIRWRRNKDMLRGNGAGQPLGILNAGSLISVSKETGQAAATIVAANIDKMYARFYESPGASPMWIANKNTFPQLAALNRSTGTSGQLIWTPAGGISGKPYSTIYGIPVVFTEHCSTLGTVGDIMLVDWTQYIIARKTQGIEASTSMHLRFDYDQMVFKIRFRWDGQPMWQTTFTPANGDTMSPFIALATRS